MTTPPIGKIQTEFRRMHAMLEGRGLNPERIIYAISTALPARPIAKAIANLDETTFFNGVFNRGHLNISIGETAIWEAKNKVELVEFLLGELPNAVWVITKNDHFASVIYTREGVDVFIEIMGGIDPDLLAHKKGITV